MSAVREKGIEPSSLTWKASIIEPLYDSRDFCWQDGIRTHVFKLPLQV